MSKLSNLYIEINIKSNVTHDTIWASKVSFDKATVDGLSRSEAEEYFEADVEMAMDDLLHRALASSMLNSHDE